MRFLALAMLLLAPSFARADAAATAAEARAAEESLDFDVATEIWTTVIGDPSVSEELRFEAHLRSGILQRIRGNDTAARLHLRYVLQRDPDYQLPPDTSPKVGTFFELVREEVRGELAAAARTAAPGSEHDDVGAHGLRQEERAPPVLWWGVAGAGALLVVAGGGAAVGGVVPALDAQAAHDAAASTRVQLDRAGYYEQRDQSALLANVLYATGAVVGVIGAGLLVVGVGGAL